MEMVGRVFAALFGAILFGIIVPIAYYFAFEHFPLGSFFKGMALLAIIGVVSGAILGARFPRVFGFFFWIFIEPDMIAPIGFPEKKPSDKKM